MLIITEKPSVANDFANALGASKNRAGYYESGNTVITNCVGHLYELASPDFYNPKYKNWKLEDLPIIPSSFMYVTAAAVAKQQKIVLQLLETHIDDEIVIATDADREGELIARIILNQAGVTDISNCCRFWVSEALTKDVILGGMKNLRPLADYNKLAQQGYARQHADWLVGMNFSRYISIGNFSVFSVGRVQTAVLQEIRNRNVAVKNFRPTPYNELEAEITDSQQNTIKAWLLNPDTKKTMFPIKSEILQNAYNDCQNKKIENAQSRVVKKINKPEKLLNINALQKAAYKEYGYSPERTLEIAQTLYENYKCLSYPRTPSRVMGDENVDLVKAKYELLKPLYPGLSGFCNESLITKDNKHIFNSAKLEAHHALIPLAKLPQTASAEEKNVFEIIIKNFFTVCMDDFIYNEKQIILQIGQHTFKTALKEILQEGFRQADRRNVTTTENEQEVPLFDENHCRISKLTILNKKTQPPKEYTIDTLLTFMEKPHEEETDEKLAGLGTPATRADIIKKLFDKNYIDEIKKKLIVTEKGIFLLSELAKDDEIKRITNVKETTAWENELEQSPAAFEQHIKEYVVACIKPDLKSVYKKPSVGLCPLCGNEMLEGNKNYYCSAYKSERECKYVIWKSICNTNVTAIDVQALLAGKHTAVKRMKNKAGKAFSAKLKLDQTGKIDFIFAKNEYVRKAK